MDTTERITDKRRDQLFQQLLQERTLIKMHLLGRGYEALTIVTGVALDDNPPTFTIDYPHGFRRAATGSAPWRMRFEFTGADRLLYRFHTSSGALRDNDIRLPLPQHIERQQKRYHFRLEAPPSAKLSYRLGQDTLSANVVNISLGGLLGSVGKLPQSASGTAAFQAGTMIYDLEIYFPLQAAIHRIRIKAAEVLRIEAVRARQRQRFALRFTQMDKSAKDALKKLLYLYQREYLRRRVRKD